MAGSHVNHIRRVDVQVKLNPDLRVDILTPSIHLPQNID